MRDIYEFRIPHIEVPIQVYITLYFPGPGVSTQQGEGRWRPTHCNLFQKDSVFYTHKVKAPGKGKYKSSENLGGPPQNCTRQKGEQIKFYA
jgi:hypothetical protein